MALRKKYVVRTNLAITNCQLSEWIICSGSLFSYVLHT